MLTSEGDQTPNAEINGKLPILSSVGLIYFILSISLTYIAIKVKKEQYVDEINKGSTSQKTSKCIFISHFVFLQVTILFRLITIAILIFYVMGLASEDKLPLMTIRMIYNTSIIFLCIVYGISLYQWVFIVHRVNLYAGLFSVENFRERFKLTRILYSVVLAGVFATNFIFVIIEAIRPEVGISTGLTSTILIELSALLVCFIVVGSILIRRLKVFYHNNYKIQRFYLLLTLLMIIVSLTIMVARYALEQ